MNKITIVIPTYGISNILIKTLFFLNFQTYKNFEVIVVDTSEKITNLDINTDYSLVYLWARKIISKKGFLTKSLARNLGICFAKTDYILFIDADMIPHPRLIYHHLQALENIHNSAIVGLELRTVTQQEFNNIEDLLNKIKNLQELENLFDLQFSNRSRKILNFRKIQWYKFLTGNLSSKKDLFIKTGMFDENFISYGFEDLELGYRFNKIGVPIFFNPKAITIHLHPLPVEKRVQNKMESVKNLKIFYQKYQNPEILNKLGINFYSKIIYDYLPPYLKEFLKKKSNDYLTNYYFWKEWNTQK